MQFTINNKPDEFLTALDQQFELKGVRHAPDPEGARELVAQLNDKQIRQWLTKWGSTTAMRRQAHENRAFLIELLSQMSFETVDVETAATAEVTTPTKATTPTT
jgi:hypothetical protein